MQISIKSSDITEYILLVDNMQAEDMGMYVCRLASDFHLESENEVWIKFKNEVIEDREFGVDMGLVLVLFPVIIQLWVRILAVAMER